MVPQNIPQIRLVHYKEFTVHVSCEERNGEWFPRYQVFLDGVPRTELRIGVMRPSMSADLALDVASELAKEDIRLGLFDYNI